MWLPVYLELIKFWFTSCKRFTHIPFIWCTHHFDVSFCLYKSWFLPQFWRKVKPVDFRINELVFWKLFLLISWTFLDNMAMVVCWLDQQQTSRLYTSSFSALGIYSQFFKTTVFMAHLFVSTSISKAICVLFQWKTPWAFSNEPGIIKMFL